MARNRRKKALYEVIGRGRSDLSYRAGLEPLHPGIAEKGRAGVSKSRRLLAWPKGPKIVQLVAGRVEISMPYQLAIAVLLGIILLALVVFRLGQSRGSGPGSLAVVSKAAQQEVAVSGQERAASAADTPVRTAGAAAVKRQEQPPVESKGRNRIVIQTYAIAAHLQPVKQYFADKGIETEIRNIGGTYYLVTAEKFENPQKKGTNGYLARRRIIELGAGYKAPPGYETFGTQPFNDAYGMRFDD